MVFDILAAASALLVSAAVFRRYLSKWVEKTIGHVGPWYFVALLLGAAIGGYGLGTLNLQISGIDGVGRSILGALVGAIIGVEAYKAATGVKGSTGLIFVAAFATTVSVGRIGCFLSGLSDQTHGVPTNQPWAVDFGDGVLRHPVQLYESLAMIGFLVWFLFALERKSALALQHGFYLLVAYYASQRFLLEFLKPYGTVFGPLNIFHLDCLILMAYAAFMIRRTRHVRA